MSTPQPTGHDDFFKKNLCIGDRVALLERSKHSVYIREGEVIGSSAKMVRVRYVPQGMTTPIETSHAPYNLIKA